MITFALIAGLGLLGPTALSSLPASQAPHATAPQDPAKDRYDRLVAEANDATAAWGKRVAALRAAELKGGDPVPAEAWESPMEAFIRDTCAVVLSHGAPAEAATGKLASTQLVLKVLKNWKEQLRQLHTLRDLIGAGDALARKPFGSRGRPRRRDPPEFREKRGA